LDTGAVSHPDYDGRYIECRDYTAEGCFVANPNRHGTHVGTHSKKRTMSFAVHEMKEVLNSQP